jgi:hypothetical protein
MTSLRWTKVDEPAIRGMVRESKRIEGYPCPFCGTMTLLQSDGDLTIDTERVEVYCDNDRCDAREIVILIKRGAGAHRRADVSALRAVERGTYEEQEADGAIVERDHDGNVVSVAWSYTESSYTQSRGEHDHRKLRRRQRATEVTVDPVEEDDGE